MCNYTSIFFIQIINIKNALNQFSEITLRGENATFKKVKNALNQFSEITLRGLMKFPSTTLRNTKQAFPSISKITLDL